MSSNSAANDDEAAILDWIAQEMTDCLRAGNTPNAAVYVDQFPALEAEILDLANLLVELERSAVHESPAKRPAIAGYRLIRCLGRGGMGVVYEADHEQLKRRVAIKCLAPGFIGDPHARERFQREARAAGRLHHTNIVPVYEVGEAGNVLYYTMQRIDGSGLDKVIREVRAARLEGAQSVEGLKAIDGRPFYDEVARIGAQMASALAYAHGQGILHRDIKPANILLAHDRTAWLTDFGLAFENNSSLTTSGNLVGTLRYLAPERLDDACDARSDIYSLGLTLYELMVGHSAFADLDRGSLVEAVRSRLPRLPRDLDPNVPVALQTIIMKTVQKEPAGRYGTADELAADLQRFLANEPIQARQSGFLELTYLWCRRNPRLALANSLAILGILASLSILLMSNGLIRRRNQDLREMVKSRDDAISGQSVALTARRLALEAAQQQRQLAEQHARRADDLVRSMSEERGFVAADRGQTANAALWFSQAAQTLDPQDPARQENLLRVRNFSAAIPELQVAFRHPMPAAGHINRLTFSPDERLLVSRAEANDYSWTHLQLWDLTTGEPLKLAGMETITACNWAGDGSLFAAADVTGRVVVQRGSTTLADWKVAAGPISELQFSPDHQSLASVAGTRLTLWHVTAVPSEIKNVEHDQPIVALTFSPDGTQIATVALDRTARLFSLARNQTTPDREQPSYVPEKTWDRPAAFATCFLNGGKSWLTWPDQMSIVHLETNQQRQLPLFMEMVARLSPNEKWVLLGSNMGCLLGGLSDGVVVGKADYPSASFPMSASFHPDSSKVAIGGSDRRLRILKVPLLTPAFPELEMPQPITCVEYAPSGRIIATAETGGTVRLLRAPLTRDVNYISFDPTKAASISYARISPDGKYALPVGLTHEASRQRTTRVVALEDDSPSGALITCDGILLGGEFLPNSQQIILAYSAGARPHQRVKGRTGGAIAIFDSNSGKKLRELPVESEPRSIEVCEKLNEAALLTADGVVRRLSLPELTEKAQWKAHAPYGNTNWYKSNGHLLYSPAGDLLATCGRDQHVRVWSTATNALHVDVRHDGQTDEATFSHDGRYLATSSWDKNEVRITDLQTGELAGPLQTLSDWAFGLEFSPDDQLLFAACRNSEARIWKWKSGELMGRPLKHTHEVHVGRFLKNGRFLITTCDDGTVRLWSVASGQIVAPIIQLNVAAQSLDVTPDEKMAVLGGYDGELYVVPLSEFLVVQNPGSDAESLVKLELAASQQVQRGSERFLSADEWWQLYDRERNHWQRSAEPTGNALWHSYHRGALSAWQHGDPQGYQWNLRQQLRAGSVLQNLRDLQLELVHWRTSPVLQPHGHELLRLVTSELLPQLAAQPMDDHVFELLAQMACQPQLNEQQAAQLVELASSPKAPLADPQRWFTLGAAEYRRGRFAEALNAIQEGRRVGLREVDSLLVEAMILHRLNQLEKSVKRFRIASAWIHEQHAGPGTNSLALWQEASELLNLPRIVLLPSEMSTSIALNDIDEILQIAPQTADEHIKRAALWAACGRFAEADRDCQAALQQRPTEIDFWTDRALLQIPLKGEAVYLQVCDEMRQNFRQLEIPLSDSDQWSIIIIRLLVPGGVENGSLLHQTAFSMAEAMPTIPAYRLLAGLSLYRRSMYREAVSYLSTGSESQAMAAPLDCVEAWLALILAASQLELEASDAAKAALRQAIEQIELMERTLSEQSPWENPWSNRVITRYLVQECEEKLRQK